MRRAASAASLALALAVVPAALATRAPTFVERATLMEAFNKPGRSFASACVRLRVSTVDGRYAVLDSPRTIPKACSRAGEVGDGYVLFRRAGRSALRWWILTEGSDVPPCTVAPARVRFDLLGTIDCAR